MHLEVPLSINPTLHGQVNAIEFNVLKLFVGQVTQAVVYTALTQVPHEGSHITNL